MEDNDETFICWRCEERTHSDDQYLMGLEYVCGGCYDG